MSDKGWNILGRTIRQVVLLVALFLLLRANATNFDATEYKTWIGMIIVGLGTEVSGIARKIMGQA